MKLRRAGLIALAAMLLAGPIAGCGRSGTSLTYIPPNEHGGWEYLGRDRDNTRYAPETQINAADIDRLGIAWRLALGEDGYLSQRFPIVVGKTIYVMSATDVLEAIDARTGKVKWSFPREFEAFRTQSRTTVGGLARLDRGVAIGNGRIFELSFDDRLQAFSRANGKPLWSQRAGPAREDVFEDMAPSAYNGLVFVGGSAGRNGTRGFIAAYSEKTGQQVWRYYTIPRRGEGWVCAKDCGGGAVFNPPTVDSKTGVVYFGTASPAPALDGAERPGPDRATAAIVALEASTGKLIWLHQEEAHDVLDYAPEQPPMIISTRVNGTEVEAVTEAGKDGYLYVLNAQTGKPLFGRVAVVPQKHSPPDESGALECPGPIGAVQFAPLAFDPQTASVYVSSTTLCELVRVLPSMACPRGVCGIGGIQLRGAGENEGGMVTAVNVTNGQIKWQRHMPAAMIGGATATASNIVFAGDERGTLYAFNAKSGAILWKGQFSSAFDSAPEIYELGGREYLLAVVGGSALTLGPAVVATELVALRLGGRHVPGSLSP